MKIAVISDLHGNHHALAAVLNDLSRKDVDEIICAGDVVDPLPGSAQVMRMLEERGIPTLRGNHEDYVLRALSAPAEDPMTYGPNWEPVRQVARSLNTEQIEAIKSWPLFFRRRDPVAGDLVICHASPGATQSGWFRGISEELGAELKDLDAGTFVCGHWHRQKIESWQSIQLVSIGSVGMSLHGKPEAEFVILEAAGGRWNATHVNIPYDREAAWREYRDSGWVEEGGPTAWLLFDELRLGVRRMTPFIAWAQDRKTHAQWPYRDRNELKSAIATYLVEVGAWNDLRQTLQIQGGLT
uniref:Calcineurin-like phosphoesterase n=1 Tax=uncultured bacterium CSLF43 TaxID=1091575 RepID=G4WW28_9BACT|nr:calcineurin-like phosphoesterase [uncultured bacterium CSLF43]